MRNVPSPSSQRANDRNVVLSLDEGRERTLRLDQKGIKCQENLAERSRLSEAERLE